MINWIKQNKILTFFIILVLVALVSYNTTDKKEGLFSGGLALAGMGIVAFSLLALTIPGLQPLAVIGLIIGTILGLFTTGTGLVGLFTKSSTIPIWAYLVGFIVLIMMFKRKR